MLNLLIIAGIIYAVRRRLFWGAFMGRPFMGRGFMGGPFMGGMHGHHRPPMGGMGMHDHHHGGPGPMGGGGLFSWF